MAYNLSRMTIYALISALEEDLRTIIKNHIGYQPYANEKFDQFLMTRAKQRLERDVGLAYEEEELSDLIDYFDLGDTYQTINSHSTDFNGDFVVEIKKHNKDFERLIPIRNRVMHIRPLDFDDLPFVFDFCVNLVSAKPEVWPGLIETISRLENDPSFVLSLKITNYESSSSVSHNLPLPDFDETGLIGRDATVKQVLKLCRGGFPVISIVGEGGVGKTALALKVAYELLEEKNLFDAVVWVTSKTTQITVGEIRDIKGAITSSVGVVQEISNQLGGQVVDNPMEEIVEYLSTFKVALFIDNLETVLDANIRDFVSSLPSGSKLIITSRIGLGAYEYPVKLNGIEESYAAQLMRTLARLRGINAISKAPDPTLKSYVKRMHLNPGYIKWFVSAAQTGLAPEAILQNSNLFLEFCMSNVYEYLSSDARLVTSTFQCAPGWRDLAELAYLSGLEAIRVQKALQELMATNMLVEASKILGASMKTTYQIAELPRAYLNKHHRPSNSLQERIRTARNKLTGLIEMQASAKNSNRYDINNVSIRVKTDRVIAKMLYDALKDIKEAKYDAAYEVLSEAQRLAPDYFEVARVFAYFHQRMGNHPEARASYELAISLSPKTAQLHFWFGRFLIREEEMLEDAIVNLELAHSLDIASPEIAIDLARAYMYQHKFSESRKILDKFEKIESDSVFSRLIGDIKVQLHYRAADDFSLADEVSLSLDSLKNMRSEFQSLPSKFKDDYIRRKLSKARPTLQRLLRLCKEHEKQTILELQSWLASEARG